MNALTFILTRLFGPWIDESIRSWRQAQIDYKGLVWDKAQRRWRRREHLPKKWDGETAGID